MEKESEVYSNFLASNIIAGVAAEPGFSKSRTLRPFFISIKNLTSILTFCKNQMIEERNLFEFFNSANACLQFEH